MNFGRLGRSALLASALCCAMLLAAGMLQAATFPEFVDPNPAPGNQFGATVVALSTGNVVITSPFDNAGGADAGAVYLFNGSTGALISTLRGSTAGDQVGSGGVTALSNGNYVVASPGWDNGAVINAGAATWGSGTNGVIGVLSAASSLVGSTAGDIVGNGGVTALSNGNYVVRSPNWDNGAIVNSGAATWGSGTTGVSGVVTVANSLVGSTANDAVGGAVTALSNGNYVVLSQVWDNGAIVSAGAATWGSGTTGVSGVVSAANSLVGSTANDQVGNGGVTALTNGNYVVASANWDNGAIADAGGATWGSGTSGVNGVVSAANSLVGSTAGDGVGYRVTALSNGSYVVTSLFWHNGAMASAGAVTWGSGTTGASGAASAANSLVGSTANNQVGSNGVTVFPNGNYVVSSPRWDNGAVVDAGAATWGSGTTGVSGVVSAANSLVGSTASDGVGVGVTVLSNGNYVVASGNWDNGAVVDAGAATWGNGTTGVIGVVSAANSLVGSTASDAVGNGGAMALSNGNYVVLSGNWDNGAIVDAGAVTWGSGTTGVSGAVSAANSLVGSTANDFVAFNGASAFSNGNYVVLSQVWDNGAIVDAGAVTWGSGTTGVSGAVSAANSLVGSTANDFVGNGGVTALTNGNYVVASPLWGNGAVVNAGAATWGSGTAGVVGAASAANSLVGSTAFDQVGNGGATALSNGNYVVASAYWDNGAVLNAGAATWGSGTTGVSGVVSAANSLVGTTANTNLLPIVADDVNSTFICPFVTEGGGRVRVGSQDNLVILSAIDIPNDQGGWLRLTFNRPDLDVVSSSTPIATYGIWRHVPGTVPAGALKANPSAALGSRPDAPNTEWLRAAIPAGLDVREVEGRFYVTGPGSQAAGIASAFPSGTWALVTSVPALQQAQYVVEVPTISNAAPNDFVVTAHTTTPSIWFVSGPASGQSVDNLAPAPPTLLTAAYSGGQTNLAWAANTEHDLGSYRLYRGTSAGFTPAIGNRIATQISTSFADVGPAGSYYKLSAVDVNGNESGFALITPGQTTGVDGEIPVVFALEGARPNPASGNGLHVAFALPSGAAARLDLLDVSGRRVLAREVGSLGAGRHTVNLAEGRAVGPGLYWVRLVQGANRRTTRVAVIE